MKPPDKKVPARFYQTRNGNEPVKEWLKSLAKIDRQAIGGDIATAEFGWPIGMPICRKIVGHKDLWEIRSRLPRGRIARILFYIWQGELILLNGFEKTTQKTPVREIETAVNRKKEHESHGKI